MSKRERVIRYQVTDVEGFWQANTTMQDDYGGYGESYAGESGSRHVTPLAAMAAARSEMVNAIAAAGHNAKAKGAAEAERLFALANNIAGDSLAD